MIFQEEMVEQAADFPDQEQDLDVLDLQEEIIIEEA